MVLDIMRIMACTATIAFFFVSAKYVHDDKAAMKDKQAKDAKAMNELSIAWATLRAEDLERFEKTIEGLQKQLDEANTIIEHQKSELGRMTMLMATTSAAGARGKIK